MLLSLNIKFVKRFIKILSDLLQTILLSNAKSAKKEGGLGGEVGGCQMSFLNHISKIEDRRSVEIDYLIYLLTILFTLFVYL